MTKKLEMDRRQFVVTTAAVGGGMAVGVRLPTTDGTARAATGDIEINAWVAINPDDSITLRLPVNYQGNGGPLSAAVGKQVTTIEGLASGSTLHNVQKAWVDNEVPQCGYCQAGMIMAVTALLKEKPKPTDADIDKTITNICRCGTFQQVREAIHAAAKA